MLAAVGIIFAIQISNIGGSELQNEGKTETTEVFVWGNTDQPADESKKDNVPEGDQITTQKGVYSPKIT